jgi:hypothetical protein
MYTGVAVREHCMVDCLRRDGDVVEAMSKVVATDTPDERLPVGEEDKCDHQKMFKAVRPQRERRRRGAGIPSY